MKSALLIGVKDESVHQALDPVPSVAAMAILLDDIGGWEVERVEGTAATRTTVLSKLEELRDRLEADDDALIYFIGHGNVVELFDVPAPLGNRPVFYLATARSLGPWYFEGVLDVELSRLAAEIDSKHATLSLILDCCHAARTMRGGYGLDRSPEWVQELSQSRACDDELLAPESHPGVIRLAASSAWREAYAHRQADGHLGRLTEAFVSVVREAMPNLDRLTWDAVAHRVREQAIWSLGCEDQWVTLAGPKQRLLFSSAQAELPWTVGFVPSEDGAGGWIRAGRLQGVELGDEWGIAALTLDEQLRPRWRARMRVCGVDLSRARVEPIDQTSEKNPPGASAHLLCAAHRYPVKLDIGVPTALRLAVEASTWLCAAEDQATEVLAHVRLEVAGLALEPSHPDIGTITLIEFEAASAIEWLEDWARAQRLRDTLDVQQIKDEKSSLELMCFVDGAACPEGAQLHVRDRVWFEIHNHGDNGWYASLVEIGVDGRPRLLNQSEPDGVEVPPGRSAFVGYREFRRENGIELCWPSGYSGDRMGVATVILLGSSRPIQLGHLTADPNTTLWLPTPRLPEPQARGHRATAWPKTGPELSREWTCARLGYQLDPAVRTSARQC
jgi:hypothetical protein